MAAPMPKTPASRLPSVETRPTSVFAAYRISREDYPNIAAALDGEGGEPLRVELERLLQDRIKSRAPRRKAMKVARLQCVGFDEVVLIKDISTSGVRLLLPDGPPIALSQLADMRLLVNGGAPVSLRVAMVRICGVDERHVEIGCQFLDSGVEHERAVTELRTLIFPRS